MMHTFHINDISNPKAKAFLEYIKTLEFISVDEAILDQQQIQAIEEARESLKENGGSSHQDVMNRMKGKFPSAFRS